MAKVMINNSEFSEIQKHIDLAKQHATEAIEDIWETEFSNLYNNFITNGFLEALYKDAESQFNRLFGTGTLIIGGGGAIVSGCAASAVASGVTLAGVAACIPVAGWIIAAIILGILAIIGIAYLVKSFSSIQFKYDAKNVFEALLTECATCTQTNYLALENVETKIENVRLSLQSVLFKIADFQTKYANLEAAAADAGVETQLASDGTTVLGIKTEVTVDGQKIETTTSDAMNAFFTYSDTVMNAEIAGDYLQREYGYDVNFADIVKNANAFMTNTLKSGLYSHEFVEQILPSNPSYDDAVAAAQGAANLSAEEIKKLLENGTLDPNNPNDAGLFGSLLGTAFLGVVGNGDKKDDSKKPDNPVGPDNPGGGTVTGPGGGYYPSGPGGGYPSGGTTTDSEKDPEENEEEESETGTDVELEEIEEIEIPEEEIKPDFGEVDYDQLARDEYEFGQSVDDIVNHRNELMAEFEKAYETGDLSEIEVSLKKYGFSDAEVEAILDDRFKCYRAMLEGDERTILAEKAVALAAADGITDYQTHWTDKPNYNDLSSDGPSELLTIRSNDETIRQLKVDLDTAKANYKTIVDETNTMVKEASANKAKVAELKAKFDKEFGADESKWSKEAVAEYKEAVKASDDSSAKVKELKEKYEEEYGTDTEKWSKEALEEYNKALKEQSESEAKVAELKEKYDKEYGTENSKWSKEAVAEYNDAVKAYNESANKVKDQLTKLDEAKAAYDENLEKFNTAKEEYFKKMNEEESNSDTGISSITEDENGDVTYSDSDTTVEVGNNGISVEDSSNGDSSNDAGDINLSNPLADVFDTGDDSDSGIRVTESAIGIKNN